jgi:hypothetical protein
LIKVEGVMGEIKLFQICSEGDLTVGVTHAMRRLGAEPNFDQSWHVWLPEGRHAAALTRYLRSQIGEESRLLVACAQFTSTRDFILIRHSLTAGCDYSELHEAISRLGVMVELPFESTFVIRPDGRLPHHVEIQALGRALGELCPDDALMVTGISHDWAYCDGGASWMFVGEEQETAMQFRPF